MGSILIYVKPIASPRKSRASVISKSSGICTACHLEDWFSHRGEAGKTGRFGALLALKVWDLMSKYQEIASNYQDVLARLKQAATQSGRDPESIRLVVVTKSQPLDNIKAVIDLGVRHLGENRVEEALPKMAALTGNTDLHWHMIGHIQSRKAINVLDGFQLIHSLDSLKLAGIGTND